MASLEAGFSWERPHMTRDECGHAVKRVYGYGFPLKCDFDHPSNSCMCCIKIEVLFMRKDLLYSDDFLIRIVYISETSLNMHLNCHNCFDHKWHKSIRPELHMWLFVYKWFACVCMSVMAVTLWAYTSVFLTTTIILTVWLASLLHSSASIQLNV